MKRHFASHDWMEHPALRVLALAWVALAAQTSGAAWAWVMCLGLALAMTRWRNRSEGAPAAPPPQPALMPAPSSVPARRRTDAARKPPAAAPEHAEPLLKAHRDTLTGLSTAEHLSDTAAPWQRDLTARGLALCVLRLGVDGFESVCQRYGSAAGDEVLIQIAKRLRHLARDEDRVLRLEAAEFMLLLSCPLEEATAFSQAVAARVVVEVQRPLAYRTVSHLPIGCSVGSALWPANGSSLNDVLAHADEALAAARHSGRGQARQYAGAPEPAPA